MNNQDMTYILSAEFVDNAEVIDGWLDVGGVKLPVGRWGHSGQGVGVYVRRSSDDLSIMEIHMTRHDGLAQEELDQENLEAERYPLGAREYWRAKMVGKYTCGIDGHPMTNEEFEEEWPEDFEDE